MSKKKQPTKSSNENGENLSKYLRSITNQMLQIKPQVELAELKARFAKANYENVLYTLQLDSLTKPIPKPNEQEVKEDSGKVVNMEENNSEKTEQNVGK